MKEILLTIVLGIIQGLTEFLPVSSSGHLTLFQEIFGLQQNTLFTNVALHLGTLFAVVVYYFKDLCSLFKKENHKTIGHLIIATIPAGIVMIFLHDTIDTVFSSSKYLCFGFLITATVLLLTDILGKKITQTKAITWKSALIMGTCQACAVLPAISRSGSTIGGGLIVARGERSEVAKFSFFMSIPIIAGSALFEALTVDYSSINIVATLLGMTAAFVTGYLAIRFMLNLIGKCNFKWFSLYLLILSIITFVNGFIVPIW